MSALRSCARTAWRCWCRANGVDLRRLCREGLPVDEFAHLQADPFARAVIEAARQEASNA